jgi:hypothetical protein
MSMRLNSPPGWPPSPPDWEPPSGWQPDPSWPDPPPGWQLWVEDTAARARQTSAATWTIAGGGAAFFGSLLPFLSSSQPDIYTINSSPKETAAVFGIILAGLGILMRARSRRTRLISAILALISGGLTLLTFAGIIVAGVVGIDETDPFGSSVHVSFSPNIGIILSIIGCIAAGSGAIMSLQHR